MTTLKMRRIHYSSAQATAQLRELRDQLSLSADVVSPRSQALTMKVFGEDLSPTEVVRRICEEVRTEGTSAVLRYTEKFDKTRLEAGTLQVTAKELAKAHKAAAPEFLDTIKRVRQNVLSFQMGLVHGDASMRMGSQYELRLRYRPMKRVGICVPGGAAAYPSTLLMTVCPAQAAGVKEIAVVMPPTPNGAYNPDLLATCYELGVTEVYRIGGAQAVAALAYGTADIPAVDMIVGPGNLFVTLAKRHVFGQVAIDCLAGPSEIVVLADGDANPQFLAADLIAQAEHDPGSSVLITWSAALLDKVEGAINSQLPDLERGELARESLEKLGALVLARDVKQAIEWVNLLGPEHLHIQTAAPEAIAGKIDNAGAIFLGAYSPVALGDYVAGPSHVLPTGGTSRFASGLTANSFLRCSSVLSFSQAGMEKMADDVDTLAKKEGLSAHAASVDRRRSNQ